MSNKLFFSAVFFVVLLYSCETGNEIVIIPSAISPDTSKTVKPDSAIVTIPPVVEKVEMFDIVFKLSHQNNTAGEYTSGEWKIDWNKPEWANSKYGYGNIRSENLNKFLELSFPAGSFQAANGYQWQAKFSQGYNELYFSYKVKFSSGFTNRNLHGKLPGLSGGSSNGGGDLPTGKDGWSGRYMFHGTSIKFYLYYPDLYKVYGDVRPVAGKLYYGNGPALSPGFTLKTGVWYTVTQRIVMNTPGKADGLVEGFIDGKLCASQTGIRFRDISTLMIDRIYFSNFFGGSGEPPSKTETISFDDFVVYTYKSSVNIARNNMSNKAGTIIPIPTL